MNKQTNVFNDPNFIDPDPIHPNTKSLDVKQDDKYKLTQVLILSRHNIRSPMSGSGSLLSSITPHDWFKWTSNPSELSLAGRELETKMGKYFREYYLSKGFLDDNWKPSGEEVRIYANSPQRTIVTAESFVSGMFVNNKYDVEHHFEVGKMDPDFNLTLLISNDSFRELAMKEINSYGGEKGLEGICEKLSDNYDVLKEVLDFYESDYYKEHGDFRLDDTKVILEQGKEPKIEGTLQLAVSASDALTLQYYEDDNAKRAAFGDTVSNDEWTKISEITDVGVQVMFDYSNSISYDVANPLLIQMKDELENKNRKFSFLCGHDSNIASVLSSLNVDDYYLPNAISRKTPIGGKLVIEKWEKDNEMYATLSMVYQSTSQLRNKTALSLANPPERYYLSFNELKTNEDGYYRYADLISLFNKAIKAFDDLPRE